MNDFAALERELIAKARHTIEPGAADQSRVRAQLATSMALLAAASPAASVLPEHPLRHLWHAHLGALSAVATAAALLAFGAGYTAGKHARAPVFTALVVSASSPKLKAANQPAAAESNEPSLASLPGLGHSGVRPRVAPSGPAAAAASTEPRDDTLAEELGLLKRAERMIRRNNAMVAIGLLNEMDRRFPKGRLLEERSAARAMANCQLVDADSARLQGQAYLAAHVHSVYAERVRAICHLDSTAKDSPGAGD